jgi:hypothetical protein
MTTMKIKLDNDGRKLFFQKWEGSKGFGRIKGAAKGNRRAEVKPRGQKTYSVVATGSGAECKAALEVWFGEVL